jgi:single-strand DNA-binding protein
MAYERISIIGHLGGDPTTNSTKDGQSVANFTVAVNRKKNGTKVTTWYRVSAWNSNAERAAKYLKKGSRVMVEGSGLHASAYIDQSGKAQASLEFNADRIIFLDTAPDNSASSAGDEDIPF